jgi:hypothetical protein
MMTKQSMNKVDKQQVSTSKQGDNGQVGTNKTTSIKLVEASDGSILTQRKNNYY